MHLDGEEERVALEIARAHGCCALRHEPRLQRQVEHIAAAPAQCWTLNDVSMMFRDNIVRGNKEIASHLDYL